MTHVEQVEVAGQLTQFSNGQVVTTQEVLPDPNTYPLLQVWQIVFVQVAQLGYFDEHVGQVLDIKSITNPDLQVPHLDEELQVKQFNTLLKH